MDFQPISEFGVEETNVVLDLHKRRRTPKKYVAGADASVYTCSNSLSVSAVAAMAMKTTTTTIKSGGGGAQSVMTSMATSQRKNSVHSTTNSEHSQVINVGPRSLSTACTATSSSASRRTFVRYTTTQVKRQRHESSSRSLRTIVNVPNAGTAHSSQPSFLTDLNLNLLIGYESIMQRKISKAKAEMLGAVTDSPMIQWSNEQNNNMDKSLVEKRIKPSMLPKAPTSRKVPTKSKTRTKKAISKTSQQKKETLKTSTSRPAQRKGKVGSARAVNKLTKCKISNSSAQIQDEQKIVLCPKNTENKHDKRKAGQIREASPTVRRESDLNKLSCREPPGMESDDNGNKLNTGQLTEPYQDYAPTIMIDGQVIEMKDKLCFLPHQHLEPSNDAELNEMKSHLSFLTPQQLDCLVHTYKIQRKDDLMNLNLCELHKMGIHQPEIVLRLMQVANLKANLPQQTEKSRVVLDKNCDGDVVHVLDDDDDSDGSNLVIDEGYNGVNDSEEIPKAPNISLLPPRENKQARALKRQNDMEEKFKKLLTEAKGITERVLSRFEKIKGQTLTHKERYGKLWSLYETLKRLEERIENLWEMLLNASGKLSVNVGTNSTTATTALYNSGLCLESLEQQNGKDEEPLILLVACDDSDSDVVVVAQEKETENHLIKPRVEEVHNLESVYGFLPNDILECSLENEGAEKDISLANVETDMTVMITDKVGNPEEGISTGYVGNGESSLNDPCIVSNGISSYQGADILQSMELANMEEVEVEATPHCCDMRDVENGNMAISEEIMDNDVVKQNEESVVIEPADGMENMEPISIYPEDIFIYTQTAQDEQKDISGGNEPHNEKLSNSMSESTALPKPTVNIEEFVSTEEIIKEVKMPTTDDPKSADVPADLVATHDRKRNEMEMELTLSPNEKQNMEDSSMTKCHTDGHDADEDSPVYEVVNSTIEKTPKLVLKVSTLTRKSPRLRSESQQLRGNLSQNIENSPVSAIISPSKESKKFKPRRLRIPKATVRKVSDTNKESENVCDTANKTRGNKFELTVEDVSSNQTVILTNRYFRNKKSNNKRNQNREGSMPMETISSPVVAESAKENKNEDDVELAMSAIHSDCGESTDNNDYCNQSEETSSLPSSQDQHHHNLTPEIETAKTISSHRVVSRAAKTSVLSTKINPKIRSSPRRCISYEDIFTFTATPYVHIQKLKLSQNHVPVSSSTTSSCKTSNSTSLKRRCLENDYEADDSECDPKGSKVNKLDGYKEVVNNINAEINNKVLDCLPPQSVQLKNIFEDMSTTDYYSSSDEKLSEPSVMKANSEDFPMVQIDKHKESSQRHLRPQRQLETKSDLRQQIKNVSNKSDLQQLEENEDTRTSSCATTTTQTTAAACSYVMQQHGQIEKTIADPCNPYDGPVKKEDKQLQAAHSRKFECADEIRSEKRAVITASPSPNPEPSETFSNAAPNSVSVDAAAEVVKQNNNDIGKIEEFPELSANLAKRQINFSNVSVNITPIASPTYIDECISSPSPVRSGGGGGILVAIEYQLSGEIDGRMTYPPIPYFLIEVDLSRNAVNKPLDINRLMKTNSLDPRIFRSHSKRSTAINIPFSSSSGSAHYQKIANSTPVNDGPAHYPSVSVHDPRNRNNPLLEPQYPIAPHSPQPSAQNALVCYNMNSAAQLAAFPSPSALIAPSGLMHSNVMHNSMPMNVAVPNTPTFAALPQHQNHIIRFNSYLQRSPWYQSLMSTMKMQINQSVSQLLRAISNFHCERLLNPGAIFDVFKIECAGEILEIMSNLGIYVDTDGVIKEQQKLPSYGSRSCTSMQPHSGTNNSMSPVNATYSFIQQVLTPTAQCTSLATASSTTYNGVAGSVTEPFVSCYLEPPQNMAGRSSCVGSSCSSKQAGGCGTSATCIQPARSCGTTCIPKSCGCGSGTTCMQHQHQHSHHQYRHQHQNEDVMTQQQPSESHCDSGYNSDRNNPFKKSYHQNDASQQRSSYNNQRFNSNNSRYSKHSSYSGALDSNSPTRSSSPKPMSSPPRGGGFGGRGGGFGRFNKRYNGGGRQSSFRSSSPPKSGNSFNNRKFNSNYNNSDNNNFNSSYNSNSPNKASSPPPPQKSPPPLSPIPTAMPGSPILNSPARQQQQNPPNSGDEECWD